MNDSATGTQHRTFTDGEPPPVEQLIRDYRERFSLLPDWPERFRYLIDLHRRAPPFPPAWRTDDRLLRECQSRVWLAHWVSEGRLRFMATADAAIVAGLATLLVSIHDRRTPAELLSLEPSFIGELGLDAQLSPHRANGLHALLGRMRRVAAEALQAGTLPTAQVPGSHDTHSTR